MLHRIKLIILQEIYEWVTSKSWTCTACKLELCTVTELRVCEHGCFCCESCVQDLGDAQLCPACALTPGELRRLAEEKL